MTKDVKNWAENEFAATDLGDKRRNERLIQLAQAIGEQPNLSLPQAMGNEAALKAAYRFFDNPANEHQEILAGHIQATHRRMGAIELVLAVQDTTYLDFSHHPGVVGLGPTTSVQKRGLVVHSTVAITPEKVMLGVLQEQVWVRDDESYAQLRDHKQRKIADKESHKWLLSIESVREAHRANPGTHFVSVGDREADLYDLFLQERPAGVDVLVRASCDRRVEDDEARYLWAALSATPVVGTLEVQVPPRKDQPGRIATLELHWKRVTLRPPKHRSAEKLPPVTVWCVWAVEPWPPKDAAKVEWMLLTTATVGSTQDALERLEWYACRWGIEVWHKVLKSGCKLELRQLGDAENLKRLLAVLSVVAWRILYTTMMARAMPDVVCTVLFSASEWQAMYCAVHKTTLLPKETPTLRETVRMVGRLGGFLGRKCDGEPGIQALWLGFQRLHDLTMMYEIMRAGFDHAK